MELASRIRKIREARQMSQSDVAYKADITPQAYGKIERRAINAKFSTLVKIADALQVSVTFLIDLKNTDFTEKTT